MTARADRDFELLLDEAVFASRAFTAIAVRASSRVTDDVTVPQLRVLVELLSTGPQTLGLLGRQVGLQPPSTSRMCDRLVRKGLIDKRRSPDSGRELVLSITGAGADVVRRAMEERRTELRQALSALPVSERAAVRRSLGLVAEAIGERRELLLL